MDGVGPIGSQQVEEKGEEQQADGEEKAANEYGRYGIETIDLLIFNHIRYLQ